MLISCQSWMCEVWQTSSLLQTWGPLGWKEPPSPGNLGPTRGAEEPGQGSRGLNLPGIKDLGLQSVCGLSVMGTGGSGSKEEPSKTPSSPPPAHQLLISDL